MFTVNETQKIIISYLYGKQNVSHAKLSEITRISKPGITQTVQPLLKEGILLKAAGVKTGRVGRREELLSLNPNYGIFLGVDKRKHHFYLSCIDFAGNPLGTVAFEKQDDLVLEIKKILSEHETCLGIAVTVRGFTTLEKYQKINPEFVSLMLSFNLPVRFLNNVECLAYVHKFHRPEDKTFMLIKYGPGVGSAVFVNGYPVGPHSEFGKMYLGDKQLEEIICFDSLFHEELEEKEGAKRLLADENLLKMAMSCLAKGLVNADALLSLDRVIFAGEVLSDKHALELFREAVKEINPDIDPNKDRAYEDYDHLNEYKAALMALIQYTSLEDKLS